MTKQAATEYLAELEAVRKNATDRKVFWRDGCEEVDGKEVGWRDLLFMYWMGKEGAFLTAEAAFKRILETWKLKKRNRRNKV
jgi:hypothetical protein